MAVSPKTVKSRRNSILSVPCLTLISFVVLLLCPTGGAGEEALTHGESRNADDWITMNKDYSSQRYVDLDQIAPANVGNLKEVCEIRLNEPIWFNSGLLKVGRTLYVNTTRVTYAFDAATCDLRWHYVIDFNQTSATANQSIPAAAILRRRADRRSWGGKNPYEYMLRTAADSRHGSERVSHSANIYIGQHAFRVRAMPRSAVAEQRHKIIRNGVALAGEESVSVGHQRQPLPG